MSPVRRDVTPNVTGHNPFPEDPHALVVEAWAQGYMVGSLIIMAFITIANMRRGVILHKLLLGIWQGFWLFPPGRSARWWLSVAAIPLNLSWWLHNIIAWMKIKPFLTRFWRLFFIITVILSSPYWVVEIYANFTYFNGNSELFRKTRPLELLFRDPWWIVTTVYLLVVIKTQYEMTLKEIVRISPRFGIMLAAMLLSITFIVLDVLSVTGALKIAGDTGINPFWKLSFVFKCLTDSVILDDFKMALDRLRAFKISRLGSFSGDFSDRRTRNDGNLIETWEQAARDAQKPEIKKATAVPSPSPKGEHTGSNGFPGFRPTDLEKGQGQHDSMVVPDQQTPRSRFMSFDLEDMVPSAIEDPPLRTMDEVHIPTNEQQKWAEDVDHLDAEADYANALRDMSGHSPPLTPSRTNHSRRSYPT
ncbi:hypothetical protein K458DRAFT_440182 [Lentithecium fluviatile CBS 122367]|uniref:Uncharacterized protein n=1 Tax=Lentithecium fluviatile CBS 122367 TaxID=1168545 RepID=A0A6G1JED0_9PLEO|nr:hypothetical protein K458DRAFT_440182 [Lentithecium fluviatile CBS 122367]